MKFRLGAANARPTPCIQRWTFSADVVVQQSVPLFLDPTVSAWHVDHAISTDDRVGAMLIST